MTNPDDPSDDEPFEVATHPLPTEPEDELDSDDERDDLRDDSLHDDLDDESETERRDERVGARFESSHYAKEERSARGHKRGGGFEGLLRDSFKKAMERGLEVGLGTLKSADHVVRNVADEVKLPKELSNYLFTQIDETKNVLIKAVAGEVRSFLDSTDIATELQRALTSLAFEVRMEIRFIPNEAGELKPQVKTKAVPRARRQERKPRTRRRDEEDEVQPDDD